MIFGRSKCSKVFAQFYAGTRKLLEDFWLFLLEQLLKVVLINIHGINEIEKVRTFTNLWDQTNESKTHIKNLSVWNAFALPQKSFVEVFFDPHEILNKAGWDFQNVNCCFLSAFNVAVWAGLEAYFS